MKTRPSARNAAFTLIEIITALSIVLVLVGLVVSVAGIANRNSALSHAKAVIKMLESSCEDYKGDYGRFPQDFGTNGGTSVTDDLSPKKHFNPTKNKYSDAGLYLYKELSGDKAGASGAALPDGVPDEGEKRYLREVNPRLFKSEKDNAGRIREVKYIVDPFGYPYGYSTAAAKQEQDFQRDLEAGKSPKRKTGDELPGFNVGSADIWSTGGNKPSTDPTGKAMELEWNKWVKNW